RSPERPARDGDVDRRRTDRRVDDHANAVRRGIDARPRLRDHGFARELERVWRRRELERRLPRCDPALAGKRVHARTSLTALSRRGVGGGFALLRAAHDAVATARRLRQADALRAGAACVAREPRLAALFARIGVAVAAIG